MPAKKVFYSQSQGNFQKIIKHGKSKSQKIIVCERVLNNSTWPVVIITENGIEIWTVTPEYVPSTTVFMKELFGNTLSSSKSKCYNTTLYNQPNNKLFWWHLATCHEEALRASKEKRQKEEGDNHNGADVDAMKKFLKKFKFNICHLAAISALRDCCDPQHILVNVLPDVALAPRTRAPPKAKIASRAASPSWSSTPSRSSKSLRGSTLLAAARSVSAARNYNRGCVAEDDPTDTEWRDSSPERNPGSRATVLKGQLNKAKLRPADAQIGSPKTQTKQESQFKPVKGPRTKRVYPASRPVQNVTSTSRPYKKQKKEDKHVMDLTADSKKKQEALDSLREVCGKLNTLDEVSAVVDVLEDLKSRFPELSHDHPMLSKLDVLLAKYNEVSGKLSQAQRNFCSVKQQLDQFLNLILENGKPKIPADLMEKELRKLFKEVDQKQSEEKKLRMMRKRTLERISKFHNYSKQLDKENED